MFQLKPILLLTVCASSWVVAQVNPGEPHANPPAAVDATSASAPAVPPAPYSLPFGLRSAVAATLVLSDTSIALYRNANGSGSTGVSFLLGSYKFLPNLSAFIRAGVVGNTAPPAMAGAAAAPMGFTVVNPALGAVFAPKLHADWKLATYLGLAIPVGMGGGNPPDAMNPMNPAQQAYSLLAATTRSGISARSAMDNAMFAVNDLVIFPGVDVAFVKWGLTVQLEATALFLMRMRGELAQADTFKLNFTTGLHVGYFFTRWLSLGGEFRYQRWLVPPAAITNATNAAVWEGVSQASAAIGPRLHLQVGKIWLRPGLSYSYGFDAPMQTAGYHVIQVVVPVVL